MNTPLVNYCKFSGQVSVDVDNTQYVVVCVVISRVQPTLSGKISDFEDMDSSVGELHNETEDDHSDKQWTEAMLVNLLNCGRIVENRMGASAVAAEGSAQKVDFSSLLHEEWKKIYPNSTLNSRNVKSRLTVYQKTLSDIRPPSKRRKLLDIGQPLFLFSCLTINTHTHF